MKLTTALENLSFFARHGLYAFEREKGATFIVDVFIDEEVDERARFQELSEVINYEEIFAIIKEEMELPRDFIEEVARTILQRIHSHLSEKEIFVKVKITKPDPGGAFGTGAAAVTLAL
jgi:7,8-dihydroneopterin aldolase/epimerase/oxygenase